MNVGRCQLTVYFEEPFWVGVFETFSDGMLKVAKVTFRNEPGDQEIYEFVLKNYGRLQFSPAVKVQFKQRKKNPKRLLKEAKRQMQDQGIGTRSQQALKLQHEQQKRKQKQQSVKQKQLLKERTFTLKQQKRKEKHRGH